MRFRSVAALLAISALVLVGCSSEPEVDPLAVTNSLTITNITDNTGQTDYKIDSGTLTTTGLGTELTLRFTIVNPNGVKFDPVSTITFDDGTTIVCRADDLRRLPSVQESTTEWDFACDADEFPEDAKGASMVVIDEYA